MKKLTLTVLVMGFCLTASAQNPPKQVTDAFRKMYKDATNVKWDQEKNNEWEAEFKSQGMEMTASFENNGTWLETESEVKKKDIPEAIMKAVNLKFKDWKVEGTEKIEKPDFTGYEMMLEKGEKKTEILVAKSGEITIKKESTEKEEEEDEHED